MLVKPNMAAPCKVEKAVTTHPTLVKSVVKALRRRSAKRIKTLEVGRDRGLWSGELDSIKIVGAVPKIRRFKPPFTFGAYTLFSRTISLFISCLPRIKENVCKKCGICASHCPMDAGTHRDGEFPKFHKEKCIKCYCCQEFCPYDAIALNGRMFRLASLMAGTGRESG